MRGGVMIAAVLLGILGWMMTITFFGAILGIPLMLFAGLIFFMGLVMRPKGVEA